MKYCEFYDYPVTGRPYQLPCPRHWEYYPETSAPHPQPCPDDGVYRCPKCSDIKGRYKIKLQLWDGSSEVNPETCMFFAQEVITDLEPMKWLLSLNIQSALDLYNANYRPSTLGPLALKDAEMKLIYEKLNEF